MMISQLKEKISPKLGGVIIEELLWLYLMLSPGFSTFNNFGYN